MRMVTVIPGLMLLLAASGAAAGEPPADPRVDEARKALMPFKKSLKDALTTALPKGAATAVSVCNEKAPELAAAASKEGVEVGRTTYRARNPKNAPAEWMKPLLDQLAQAPKKEGAFAAKTLADGRLAYAEPIYIQPMCLTCHGDAANLGPEVTQILAEKYPADQATGYKDGEFRGIFWVTVPKAK